MKKSFALLWLVLIFALSPRLKAEVLTPLTTDRQSMIARAQLLLQEPISKVRLVTYAFAEDRAGLAMATLLKTAALSGADVEIILDAYKARISDELLFELQKAGVKVYFYNTARVRNIPFMNHRLHDKILTVNSDKALIGDKNIGNNYFGPLADNDSMSGNEILLEGESVQDIDNYFEEIKKRPLTELADPVKDLALFSRTALNIEGLKELQAASLLPLRASRFIVPRKKIRFIGDKQNPTAEILKAISSSSQGEQIFLENAYLVDYPALGEALHKASLNQASIKILTNSPETTNHQWVAQATVIGIEREAFAKAQIAFTVYRTNHSKLSRIGETLFIGSVNLDPRSAYINSESVLEIHDQALSEYYSQIQDNKWRRANLVHDPEFMCRKLYPFSFEVSPAKKLFLNLIKNQL